MGKRTPYLGYLTFVGIGFPFLLTIKVWASLKGLVVRQIIGLPLPGYLTLDWFRFPKKGGTGGKKGGAQELLVGVFKKNLGGAKGPRETRHNIWLPWMGKGTFNLEVLHRYRFSGVVGLMIR